VIVSVFPQVSLPGLTRISLGIQNSTQEIDTLLHVLEKIARQPRPKADNPSLQRRRISNDRWIILPRLRLKKSTLNSNDNVFFMLTGWYAWNWAKQVGYNSKNSGDKPWQTNQHSSAKPFRLF